MIRFENVPVCARELDCSLVTEGEETNTSLDLLCVWCSWESFAVHPLRALKGETDTMVVMTLVLPMTDILQSTPERTVVLKNRAVVRDGKDFISNTEGVALHYKFH